MKLTFKRAISMSAIAMAGTLFVPKPVHAVLVPDFCSAFMDGAVLNDKGAYCVSNFGWSDTWYSIGVDGTFPPFPGTYDRATDLFSGDDSPNLRFKDQDGNLLSGTGWLSPIMDGGALFPSYNTGSAWQLDTALEYLGSGTDTLQSKIFYELTGGRLDVTITTHLTPDGKIVQTFDLINNSLIDLTELYFADYFNFHPNGSDLAATQVGSTSFNGGSILTGGDRNDPSFIGNGQMSFSQNDQPITPDNHHVGLCTGPVNPGDPPCIPIISAIESGPSAFNDVNFAGIGDSVGVLGKSLSNNTGCIESSAAGILCKGQAVSIQVNKSVVPEPESLLLLMMGYPFLWWQLRKPQRIKS